MGTMTTLQVMVFSAMFLGHPAPDEVERVKQQIRGWAAHLSEATRNLFGAHPQETADQRWTKEWIDESRKNGPIKATVLSRHYEPMLRTVTITECQIWIESPQRWRVDQRPPKHLPDSITIGNVQYETKAGRRQSFVRHQQWFRTLTPERTSELDFENVKFPNIGLRIFPDPRMTWLRWLAFPHLYPADLASIEISQGQMPNSRHLVLSPTESEHKAEFQRMELLLDQKTFLPTHFKIWDAAGTTEIVYFISEWHSVPPIPDEIFEIRELPPDP